MHSFSFNRVTFFFFQRRLLFYVSECSDVEFCIALWIVYICMYMYEYANVCLSMYVCNYAYMYVCRYTNAHLSESMQNCVIEMNGILLHQAMRRLGKSFSLQ